MENSVLYSVWNPTLEDSVRMMDGIDLAKFLHEEQKRGASAGKPEDVKDIYDRLKKSCGKEAFGL